MKQRISIKWSLVPVSVILLLVSCSTPRGLVFADREWCISNSYGQTIASDTTYRMLLGYNGYPESLTIISSLDSAEKYPGMKNFIADVLHTAQLDSAQVLLYAPHMSIMFVKPLLPMKPVRPSSLTSPMDDKAPYTMWTYEEYPEEWNRDSTEMFTYTYYDKGKKRLLAVDWFNYGDEPFAQIMVWQSRDKQSAGMKLPWLGTDGFDPHNLKKIVEDIEYWGHQLDARRVMAIENYKIGLRQAKKRFNGQETLAQANSAMFSGSFSVALELYRKILKYEDSSTNMVLYNAACAASMSGDTSQGLAYLEMLADKDSLWYFKEPLDMDLQNLTYLPDWGPFYKKISMRRENFEKNFDISLRSRLTQIRRSDQDVRHRFLSAYNTQPQDTILISSLIQEMKEIDSNNLIEINNILSEYGWPAKDKVGDECVAIWLVIQHADVDSQRKALPMLKLAAEEGDINPSAIAMLEDRILVNSGKKQIYGTQYYYPEESPNQRVIYPIDDVKNVDIKRTKVGLEPLKQTYSKEELETVLYQE